jgi:hypothetical protein
VEDIGDDFEVLLEEGLREEGVLSDCIFDELEVGVD